MNSNTQQFWFSTHPEAIREINALITIFENFGYTRETLKEVNTVDGYFNLLDKSAKKAFADGLTVTKDINWYANSKKQTTAQFEHKMIGNGGEYFADAVINSGHGFIRPSNWCRSDHRAEYNIPDHEMGSPDRIILDLSGKPYVLLNIKFRSPNNNPFWWNEFDQNGKQQKGTNTLKNSCVWPVTYGRKHPELNGVLNIGLFTNQLNVPKDPEFLGGTILGEQLRRQFDVSDESNTDNQMFWNNFYDQLYATAAYGNTFITIQPTRRVPDQWQRENIIYKIPEKGVYTNNAPCGIGKMVIQTSMLPTTRSINLVMSGVRLVLAQQMNESMFRDVDGKFNIVHVMSKGDYQKTCNDHPNIVSSQHIDSEQLLAHRLYDYAMGNDQHPLYLATIQQSLHKIMKAFKILRDGKLLKPGTNVRYEWCTNSEKRQYTWEKIVSLCKEAIYDEAHNLVAGSTKRDSFDDDDANESIKETYIDELPFLNEQVFDRSTYWTATINLNGTAHDMSNTRIFGKPAVYISPTTAQKLGYTVRPKLIAYGISDQSVQEINLALNLAEYTYTYHGKDADGKNVTEEKHFDDKQQLELAYYIKTIEDAYHDCTARGLATRAIVFVKDHGMQEVYMAVIKKYIENKLGRDMYINNVTKDTPYEDINVKDKKTGLPITQEGRSSIFKNFATHDFSVLFNYAIVHEGFDVDGCTATILGRNLNQVWLVQAIGRACRLLKSDRDRVFNDPNIVPEDRINHYQKQYGLVYTYLDENSLDSRTNYDEVIEIYDRLVNANKGEEWFDCEQRNNRLGTRTRPTGKIEVQQQAGMTPATNVNEDLLPYIRKVREDKIKQDNSVTERKLFITTITDTSIDFDERMETIFDPTPKSYQLFTHE